MDAIRDLLTRYNKPAFLDCVANAVASDYLRKMNVDELPSVCRFIESLRPDVAAAIADRYPQHWGK